jgi:anion-transporting  ArsA/GET3 family ATPase
VYDAVVLDAPPTGRIARFLNVTAETAKLAKVGPIKTQSEGVAAILRSPLTAVHVVTLLEEMPVQETADATAELTELGMSVGAIIVNETRPALLDGGKVTQAELRRGLSTAGLPADRATVAGLAAEVAEYRARLDLERRLRGELDKLDRLMLELPLLPEGIDVSALYSLAETLTKQGVVTA